MVRLGVVLLLCSVAAVLGIPDIQNPPGHQRFSRSIDEAIPAEARLTDLEHLPKEPFSPFSPTPGSPEPPEMTSTLDPVLTSSDSWDDVTKTSPSPIEPEKSETTTYTAHLDEVNERGFIDTSSSTTAPVNPESSTPKAEEPTTPKEPSPETAPVNPEATTPKAEEPTTPKEEPMANAPLPQPDMTPLPPTPSKPSQPSIPSEPSSTAKPADPTSLEPSMPAPRPVNPSEPASPSYPNVPSQPPVSVNPPQPPPTGFPTFAGNPSSSASYFPGAYNFPSNTPSSPNGQAQPAPIFPQYQRIPGYDAFLPTFSGMPYPFPVNQMNPAYPYQPLYPPVPYPYIVPPGYTPYPTPPAQSAAYPTNSLTSPAFLIYNPQLGYVNPSTGAVVVPIASLTAPATAASESPNKSHAEKPSAELLPPKAEGDSATKGEAENIWAAKRKLINSTAQRVKESKEGVLKMFDAFSQHLHDTVDYKTKLFKKPFEFVRDQAEGLLQSMPK